MLNPRAVLFDLDNTLYHWNPCDAAGRKAAHACLRTAADVDAETFLAHYRAARAHLRHVLRGQAASHDRLLFFQIVVGEVLGRPEPGLVLAMATSRPSPSRTPPTRPASRTCWNMRPWWRRS